MPSGTKYDAVIVGAGPNGLSAAIEIARAGKSVVVLEARDSIGGGARTAELTQPGFWHDICSAIHPMAAASPFFNDLPLAEHGLDWIHPPIPLAHPFDDGSAATIDRSIETTAASLEIDAAAYRKLMLRSVNNWEELLKDILAPLHLPRHPITLGRFGLRAVRSGAGLARKLFAGHRAQALFAGLAAHSVLPLEQSPSAAVGLVLGIAAHAVGWPLPRGGASKISDALAAYLLTLSGHIETGVEVTSLGQVPESRVVLFDVTPRQLLRIANDHLPSAYRRRLKRYRYGPGVFKIDWALDGAIPWRSQSCMPAGTLHLGGSLEEIAAGEREVWRGEHPRKPFVLLAQQSLFDPTRAPPGKHTAWAYCHVPNGSTVDMTTPIEDQVERFAPGFRKMILARHTMNTSALEQHNANCVGGDISGGVADFGQLFFRPVRRLVPYATPNPRIFICSSSTPPGGGVHGMCGYHAARAVLRSGLL